MSTAIPLLAAFDIFDAHFHIIDRRFPLIANQGYLPDDYGCADYLERMRGYRLVGGAVVSGSFQAFDQSYLVAALRTLGPAFVGVTQLPASVSDEELRSLDAAGVRAVRFNLKRGGSAEVKDLDTLARRVHDIVGWHAELFVDAAELPDLFATLVALPAVSIDHLGLSQHGFPTLLKLAERGIRVKATGFGRVDFAVGPALQALYQANPQALIFGSDLPCTRAPRPYTDADALLIVEMLGEEGARRVLCENARLFYCGRAHGAPQ
ncbi:MAG TPA: 2-pyrone-4,6-dicarboxylate hydrolase [Desulfuromonas sp.]|nr:2-pyrone-4,6-dicarboxylate hydrolase [Desulfuromonas sp.]